MKGIASEFKEFISRGNMIELAVAVVIGGAFGALIASLVADILTPIIAAIFGQSDFSALTFTINGSVFKYGSFLNAVIAFLTVSAAIFFFVVKPMNVWTERAKAGAEPEVKDCPECLSEIPYAAKRCAHCTATLS